MRYYLWSLVEKLRDFHERFVRNIAFYELLPASQNNLRLGFEGKQMANAAAAPYIFCEKTDMLHFTLQGISLHWFSLPVLSWSFISLVHSTKFWLLLASAVHRNWASLCNKIQITNVQIIWDRGSINNEWLVCSNFPSRFYNIHRTQCLIIFVM